MDAAPGVSPSFNSYFNNKFAEMAARVVGEFDYHEEFIFDFENNTEQADDEEQVHNMNQIPEEEEEEEEENEEEFEFTFAPKGLDNSELLSPISAGEIFQNGLIRPVYPLFNRDLLTEKEPKRRIRIPLRKLFFEERETTLTTSSSSSSSESENMDGVPAESYCLWQPKEKSRSTGSDSKRWKFSDLLHRSKSDGSDKDRLVILGHINQSKVKQAPVAPPSLPRPRSRSGSEKGHLTYKQELVGFFGRVM